MTKRKTDEEIAAIFKSLHNPRNLLYWVAKAYTERTN